MSIAFLGIDTGGTFTDFVLLRDGQQIVHKVLSTPEHPQRAILQGIDDLGLTTAIAAGNVMVVHGTTVATNAALEGKGVRTVYITNRGLGDALAIGRQTRTELYNLTPSQPASTMDDALNLEVDARLAADGTEIQALTPAALDDLEAAVDALAPTAIAINLLFSFLNPQQEQQIEARFTDRYFVSRSSMILPEFREYERGITTWLNAWIGPLIKAYLVELGRALAPSKLAIMQSSGLTVSAALAAERAVNLLLSGPAGGLEAALYIGRKTGAERLMTFDMGGTSTDVALLEGAVRLTNQGHLGPYPVAVPMADIHTIGAGGGSIAYVDGGGLLQVGPVSAGADPGPACYGRGGMSPTVTDANLILGRLRSDAFLGGQMALDAAAAHAALAPLADTLGLSVTALAAGIIRLANEQMVQALRVISIQQGHDPRDFTLMSFGGAGGLHLCDLAEALEIRQALVPVNSGVLSALGMLTAQPGRELSKTHRGLLKDMSDADLQPDLQALLDTARNELRQEGVHETRHQFSLDLRYLGQSFSIAVAYQDLASAAGAFHNSHKQLYGHTLDQAVELVNLRVHVEAAGERRSLPDRAPVAGIATPVKIDLHCELTQDRSAADLWQRQDMSPGQSLKGPALITEAHTTVFLKAGWDATLDHTGNLLLSRNAVRG